MKNVEEDVGKQVIMHEKVRKNDKILLTNHSKSGIILYYKG